MSLELIYTSVSRGLSPGSSGFCTAAATGGMSRQVMGKLEALSGYSFHFNLSDPKANLNPVDYAHTHVRIGSETLSVLSRVAFCGADYSGRTNKIAHHFLLEHGEQLPGGPAWMMRKMAQQTFVAGYSGEPKNLPKRDLRAALPPAPGPASPAAAWQKTTGDAGWAGMLVKAFRENPKVPAFVVFSPGQELLPLFEESLALLPPEDRWQVGFATYYTALPVGCQYHWRGVLAGSAAAREMARFPNATLIDLTASLGRAPANLFTEAARTGAVLPPVRVVERPRIRVVERAPQPPASVPVAEEVGTLPGALETERRAVAAPPPGVWPSPAQLSILMARARRARWVKPLLVGNIVLAAAVVVLAILLVPDLRMSWQWAKVPTKTEEKPGPTSVAAPTVPGPDRPTGAEPILPSPDEPPAPETPAPKAEPAPEPAPAPTTAAPQQKGEVGTGEVRPDAAGHEQRPPLPPLEKGWANRLVVVPTEHKQVKPIRQESEIRFEVGRGVQFFPLRIKDDRLSASLLEDKPGQMVIEIRTNAQPGNTRNSPWKLVCSLEDEKNQWVLVCRPDGGDWKDAEAEVRHLVVEVWDNETKCVWQCPLGKFECQDMTLDLGRKPPSADSGRAVLSITHPWPGSLILMEKPKKGPERKLAQNDKIERPSEEQKPALIISVNSETEQGMFCISGSFSSLKDALDKLSTAQKNIDVHQNSINKASQKKKDAEVEIQRIKDALAAIKDDKERKAAEGKPEIKTKAAILQKTVTREGEKIASLSARLRKEEEEARSAQDEARSLSRVAKQKFTDTCLEVRDAYERPVAVIRFKFSDTTPPAEGSQCQPSE